MWNGVVETRLTTMAMGLSIAKMFSALPIQIAVVLARIVQGQVLIAQNAWIRGYTLEE